MGRHQSQWKTTGTFSRDKNSHQLLSISSLKFIKFFLIQKLNIIRYFGLFWNSSVIHILLNWVIFVISEILGRCSSNFRLTNVLRFLRLVRKPFWSNGYHYCLGLRNFEFESVHSQTFFGSLVLHQFPKNQEKTPFLKSLYKPSEELPSCPCSLGVMSFGCDAAGVSSNPPGD